MRQINVCTTAQGDRVSFRSLRPDSSSMTMHPYCSIHIYDFYLMPSIKLQICRLVLTNGVIGVWGIFI